MVEYSNKQIRAKYNAEANPIVALLSGKTPQQAATYIQNNVTNLAEAKEVLKMLAAAVVSLQAQVNELKSK
jgi:hypothetical protein